MTSFTNTFGGSAVSPADVAYAAYTFGANLQLFWPQFAEGQTNVAARFMSLTATTVSLNVLMPDATLNSVGYDAIIFNAGSDTFNVVDFNGGAIVTIAPGQTYYLMLTSNAAQSGTWLTIQFGVGTGSANAAALAGFGLMAMAGLLEVNFIVNGVSNDFPITSAGRGQLYNWTGGAGTITLPAAASVGNGFFFMLANNGSGSITVEPSSGTIDGLSTSTFSQTQSGFIISDGSNWETVGKGLQNTFAVTLLNLNVAGGSNVTETSAQAQNIIQQFTGLLTANIAVIVPTTVQLYFVSNQTTGAFTLTVKTASGTGIVVPQGSNAILYCDGTNVVNAFTASVSGTLALTSGSAVSPSLFFQSFPGTGIFSPGANLFSITSNTTEVMRFSAQASSVNYFGVVASAAGSALAIGAVGTDTNININIIPKGTGYVALEFLDNTVIGANVPEAITGTVVTASTDFAGPGTGLTGTAAALNIGGNAGTATNAINIATTAVTANASFFPLFAASSSNSDQAASLSTGLTFNPSTNTLTTTGFVGALTGNVTGNISGSSGSTTGNAATVTTNANLTGPVTSVGNATSIAAGINLPGSPTTTTQAAGDNSTKVATTAYVDRNASAFAKAWAVFDGTLTGTNAPLASFNVSNITRTSTGIYGVNFTNNLSSANYAPAGMARRNFGANDSIGVSIDRTTAPTASTLTIAVTDNSDTFHDSNFVSITVFAN